MTVTELDLVVRNGLVVTGSGESVTDIGVRDGVIVQLGGSMTGAREIDATGRLVLPGGVDMHVHLSPVEVGEETMPWADDFVSGSRAAAAGGVTTIGNIGFGKPGERLVDLVQRVGADGSRDSLVDFVVHPVLMEPDEGTAADIERLAELGHTSVKIFMSIGDFDVKLPAFVNALDSAGKHGLLSMVHCEDACVIEHATAGLLAEGHKELQYYPDSHPELSERMAVNRIVAIAEATGAPIYIVHLGSAAALTEARAARARGQRVYVETRPIYLYFTEERFAGEDGPLFVGNPPLRGAGDQAALWAGLAAGHVDTCCTDHAAWTLEDKLDPELTIATARPGMSELETLIPVLYSEGVRKGRLTLQRFVEVTSTNAAKLFGLFPQKGTIAVGSDADLVIWDPDAHRPIVGAEGMSRSGYSLYEGWDVVGAPAQTISRGEVVYSDGHVQGEPGRGRMLRRGPTRDL
ncbi:amidohydrolase family protein [Jatrophihabitans lederbergiae]|uniref:Amidohydrolase family protein n=1 Tax=Jatrophihabitans lederbergiae TaxID=3075547 RepID=A0ABU2JCE3_9ACTN|nr:amidohydrolase family protein [Jatrophihabitans sp. DSM 44399]MDT0262646.1 amidohydrolase family protein [Jatrophihabitans sp. DSM 44399]